MEREASEHDVELDVRRDAADAPGRAKGFAALKARATRLARGLAARHFMAVRTKVVTLLVLVGLGMSALSVIFVLHVYRSDLAERMRSRADAFSEVIQHAVAQADGPVDLNALTTTLAGTSRIERVAIVNAHGLIVASSVVGWRDRTVDSLSEARIRGALSTSPKGLERVVSPDGRFAEFIRPIALQDGRGTIFIRINASAALASLQAKAWSVLAWLAGAIVVSVLTISLLLQRLLVTPIEALRRFAERRQGRLPAVAGPDDEIGIVARTLAESFAATSASEARLADLAQRDGLTGLGNWAFFKSRLAHAIADAARTGETVGVMILNLDSFKDINDTLGHDAGDAILQRTAEILSGCRRENDAVARLGADEFGIVLRGISSSDEAVEMANRFIRAVGAPFRIGVHELHQTACVGLTLYPQDARDPDVLLKNADLALSRAKLEGSGACVLYRHELHLRAMERNSIERDLRTALAQKQFVLFYQPKVDIHTGRVAGAEALIRWQHPERGLVPPDLFIPVAERCGFIAEVTKWVLDEACRQNRAWQDLGLPKVGVAINVSAVDLRRADLTDMVANTLVRHALSPQYLELEVTESMVMRDVDVVIGTLRRLRSLGVGIGIDDFGTGYSSLAYLKRFPVKRLKIDRSFVRDIADSREGKVIPKVIIDLAHSLSVNVLAEGVEDAEQLAILRSLGCDEAQGYFLGKPMPAEEFEAFLRTTIDGLHPDPYVRDLTNVAPSVAASLTPLRGAPGSAA